MAINICFATDKNYIKYMATSMMSILKNSTQNEKIHFYILCNNISKRSKEEIKSLNQFKSFDITFYDLDIEEFQNFPAGGEHITNTTYFRYKLAEIFKNIDKIIYLDCDVIVKKSLLPLFDINIEDFYIAGVEDVGYYYWRTVNPEYKYRGFYINAGVLLINLKKWRENKIFEKLMKYTIDEAKNIKIGDQDVINAVLENKILPIDYEWNVQDSFYRAEPEKKYNPNKAQITKAANSPAIIHYTQKYKPWNNPYISEANDWWWYHYTIKYKYPLIEYIRHLITIIISENKNKNKNIDIWKFIFSIYNSQQFKFLRIFGVNLKIKTRI